MDHDKQQFSVLRNVRRRKGRPMVGANAKRAVVGAGARVLFYPTLLYNLVRHKIQADFRWWDQIDQFLFMGAVPFPTDVPRLYQLGVRGVITLNEPYETLVPPSLYEAHGIDHLVLPTRDYLYAPSLVDICEAVDFIHSLNGCIKLAKSLRSASNYVYSHIKEMHLAGRLRISIVKLGGDAVEHKNMAPAAAFEYVRSIRPRVLLHPSQWQAIQEFSKRNMDPAVRSQKTRSSPTGDAMLARDANLDGCGTGKENDACAHPPMSYQRTVKANPTTATARVSRLFSHLRTAGRCLPVSSRKPEIYAS